VGYTDGMPAAALGLVVALLLPGGRCTAYFASAFTDTAYEKDAVAKVLKAWKSPSGAPAGKKTVVIAQIAKDGSADGLRFNMTTGFKPWDDAAMAAVKKAAPFAPLPKSWSYPTMEVHFHFEVVSK
jgi:periplasmic protein TonB